jgi:formate hydrogenlyase subunit 3/multisubunit Na+/H+ antiporter MnhD subunit
VLPGLELSLVADALALLFVTLSAVLWLVTTVYAIGYLEGSPNRTRFFSFFSLCVTATTGIAMAGDLFTFVLFYEALTWATYPWWSTGAPRRPSEAGRRYLVYTLASGPCWSWAPSGSRWRRGRGLRPGAWWTRRRRRRRPAATWPSSSSSWPGSR